MVRCRFQQYVPIQEAECVHAQVQVRSFDSSPSNLCFMNDFMVLSHSFPQRKKERVGKGRASEKERDRGREGGREEESKQIVQFGNSYLGLSFPSITLSEMFMFRLHGSSEGTEALFSLVCFSFLWQLFFKTAKGNTTLSPIIILLGLFSLSLLFNKQPYTQVLRYRIYERGVHSPLSQHFRAL